MKTMKELFEILLENGDAGRDSMIVTVTKSSGSAPRGAGSRMIVLSDGTSHGTIGGGSIEYEATKEAVTGIEQQTSFFKSFVLRPKCRCRSRNGVRRTSDRLFPVYFP